MCLTVFGCFSHESATYRGPRMGSLLDLGEDYPVARRVKSIWNDFWGPTISSLLSRATHDDQRRLYRSRQCSRGRTWSHVTPCSESSNSIPLIPPFQNRQWLYRCRQIPRVGHYSPPDCIAAFYQPQYAREVLRPAKGPKLSL